MEYTIVEGQTHLELIKKVDTLIEQGWKPIGGLAIGKLHLFTCIYQAMIREAKKQ
jgi:hypothetical protein